MYTAEIFTSIFLAILGFLWGKSFKDLNPIYIILGLSIIFFPAFILLAKEDKIYYNLAFGFGFLLNFKGIISNSSIPLFNPFLNFQLYRARKRQDERKREFDINDELRRKKNAFEQEASRKDDELRRREEDLKRKQREQEASNDSQDTYTSHSKPHPRTFEEACAVFGMSGGKRRAEYKKAHRKMVSGYHPDKTAHLGKEIRKMADEKTLLANLAWEIIKKKLG